MTGPDPVSLQEGFEDLDVPPGVGATRLGGFILAVQVYEVMPQLCDLLLGIFPLDIMIGFKVCMLRVGQPHKSLNK